MLDLPAELEDEYQELQFALDNTERGGWFFCVYKQASVRDELIIRLKNDCQLPIFQWQYSSENPSYPIDYLKNLNESQQQNRAIVFFLNVTSGGGKIVKSLDFNREKFSEYPHCLVFFVTELELKEVAVTAGHFWAQRRGRFDFSELFIAEQKNEQFNAITEWNNPLLHIQNYQEAEKQLAFYLQELAKSEQQETLSLAELYNKIAYILYFLGRYQKAIPYCEKALEINERQLGENHLNIANNLSNLAKLYYQQVGYEKALPFYQRASTIREQQLEKNHSDNIANLNNLADLHRSKGNYTEALPLYQRALAICEQQLGENHPDTAISLNKLAGLYKDQGRYTEAQPLYQRALTICKNVLGEEHPNTQLVKKNYNTLLQKLNNP